MGGGGGGSVTEKLEEAKEEERAERGRADRGIEKTKVAIGNASWFAELMPYILKVNGIPRRLKLCRRAPFLRACAYDILTLCPAPCASHLL